MAKTAKQYECRFPKCGRIFAHAQGRAMHERWMHDQSGSKGKEILERIGAAPEGQNLDTILTAYRQGFTDGYQKAKSGELEPKKEVERDSGGKA